MKETKKDIKKVSKKKSKKDLPVILVRLGDKEKGWIPNHEHALALAELLEKMGLNERYNFIIYHYGIDMELVDKKGNIEDYGLRIVDQDKFEDFIKETMKSVPIFVRQWQDACKREKDKKLFESPQKPIKAPLRKTKETVG